MIQILEGNPQIQPGSVRIPLDPIKHDMYEEIIYEFVYKIQDWGLLGDIIGKIKSWIAETFEGLEVVGYYREGDYLVMQVRRKKGARRKKEVMSLNGRIFTLPAQWTLAIIFGIAAIFLGILLVFLTFGLRLAVAGLALIFAGLITLKFASDWYRLVSIPLFLGGIYLMTKQFLG